jgi:hypothetical protein
MNKQVTRMLLVVALLGLFAATVFALEGWRDAGAASMRAAPDSRAEAVYEAWLDAGVGKDLAFGQAAALMARRAEGELMVARWKSDKLAAQPDAPFEGWEFRFADAGGAIKGVTEYEIVGGGSRPAATYGMLRGEGLVVLSRRDLGGASLAQPFATVRRVEGGYEVTAAVYRSTYRRLPGGGLGIRREVYGSTRGEDYLPGGSATLTEGGATERRGFFDPAPTEAARTWVERKPEDPRGILDRMYWYEKIEDDSVALAIGDVEPVASLRVEGLAALTSGPEGLENLAIADTVLGLDRRMTPVLALAWMGIVPPKGR